MAMLLTSVPVFAAAQHDTSSKNLVKQIKQQSKKYRTLNSEKFAVGSSLNDVIAAWGEPDDLGTVAANYWDRNIRFFYDENSADRTITGIDAFDPALQTIRLKQVYREFGTKAGKEQEGNYYVTYPLGKAHQITFVFQSITTSNNPTLELYTIN